CHLVQFYLLFFQNYKFSPVQDFQQLLDDNLELLAKLKDSIVDWVQEGFQDFFKALNDRFILFCGGNMLTKRKDQKLPDGLQGDKYVNTKTQKIFVLLKERITTPNWIKDKEPKEVHMFVDLLLQELEAAESEVKQILVRCSMPKHHRSDSTGSANSSRSNPLRDKKISRSNTQQESVISTIVKLCLKSFVQFVRLQTFNRSGFQQIQLDIQFLRAPLKEIADDDAVIDFLLDEVNET
ncbi:Vacuolar sorting-associated protein, partial [Nymphaea thermarum]